MNGIHHSEADLFYTEYLWWLTPPAKREICYNLCATIILFWGVGTMWDWAVLLHGANKQDRVNTNTESPSEPKSH